MAETPATHEDNAKKQPPDELEGLPLQSVVDSPTGLWVVGARRWARPPFRFWLRPERERDLYSPVTNRTSKYSISSFYTQQQQPVATSQW